MTDIKEVAVLLEGISYDGEDLANEVALVLRELCRAGSQLYYTTLDEAKVGDLISLTNKVRIELENLREVFDSLAAARSTLRITTHA